MWLSCCSLTTARSQVCLLRIAGTHQTLLDCPDERKITTYVTMSIASIALEAEMVEVLEALEAVPPAL